VAIMPLATPAYADTSASCAEDEVSDGTCDEDDSDEYDDPDADGTDDLGGENHFIEGGGSDGSDGSDDGDGGDSSSGDGAGEDSENDNDADPEPTCTTKESCWDKVVDSV